ncbi:MAG TPA: hypothetical protein VGA15_09060, partial [Bradyrhizobium sp.]
RHGAHVCVSLFPLFWRPRRRRFDALGSDSQHFPSLAKPVRREMTFSPARARSSVLIDMPLAFAFSSRSVAATSPSASSRRRKAMAWSIRFGSFRFWPIDFTL